MQTFFIIMAVAIMLAFVASILIVRRLDQQVEQIQLEAHKELFPQQIWGARRAFRRNLRRTHKQVQMWRILGVTFGVITALLLLFVLFLQFVSAPVGLDGSALLVWFFSGSNLLRTNLLWVAAGAGILGVIFAGVGEWQTVQLEIAGNGDNARVVFWEPEAISSKRLKVRLADAALLGVTLFGLAMAGQLGVLPDTPAGLAALAGAMNTDASESTSATSTAATTSSTDSSAAVSSSAATSRSASASDDNQVPSNKEASTTDVFAATPASASVLAKVTDVDKAVMYYMTYYSFLGKDAYSQFTGNSGGGSYYYQIVHNGGQLFIAYYYTLAGTTYYTNYAYEVNGTLTFYALNGVQGKKTELTDMTSMSINQGTVTPTAEPQSDPVSVAKVVGNYFQQTGYKQDGYKRVQDNLKPGVQMTAY